jgi:hypothetical protein
VLLVRGGEQLLVVVSSIMGVIKRLLSDKRRYPEQVHTVSRAAMTSSNSMLNWQKIKLITCCCSLWVRTCGKFGMCVTLNWNGVLRAVEPFPLCFLFSPHLLAANP